MTESRSVMQLADFDALAAIAEERGQEPGLTKLADTIVRELGGVGLEQSYRSEEPVCAMCGKRPEGFTDELSAKEFRISRLCQVCQDDVFKEPEEDYNSDDPEPAF